MGAFTFAFGFAMIWYIWWLAVVSLIALLVTVVMRANDENVDYTLSADEVARIESNGLPHSAHAPSTVGAPEGVAGEKHNRPAGTHDLATQGRE